MSNYRHLAEIERVVQEFGDGTLPCAQWTHAAHLTVGLWYLRDSPPHEALDRVREAIKRYNAHCGRVDSPTGGYHETLTRFYLWLIGRYLNGLPDCSDWLAVTNGLLAHDDAGRDAALRYYTRERLMSAEARSGWVPPDLLALA
ncbi:MAG: hypothetical protein AB7O59_17730 [Pirellulales bacterium]